jgi:signal-transduction protein with cAMP-binding, CBS, and nucleotidyltransferase domain
MTAQGTSAILVAIDERTCIVTDADMCARVVGGDVPRDSPVSVLAGEAVRVESGRLAVDAVVDMLEAGVDHLIVVDRGGSVVGIVSATDLMGLETWSPFALRHAALRAHDEDELVASRAACGAFLAFLGAGLPSVDIERVLTLQLDSRPGSRHRSLSLPTGSTRCSAGGASPTTFAPWCSRRSSARAASRTRTTSSRRISSR